MTQRKNLSECPDMMKSADVAQVLGVSKTHARMLMSSGALPAVQIGARWYVSKPQFIEAMNGRAVIYE